MTDKKKLSNNRLENEDTLEKAANLTTTLNPLIGVDPSSLFQSWMKTTSLIFKNPKGIVDLNLSYSSKIMGVMTKEKKFNPDKKDKRFQDAAWQEMPMYSYLMQSYLALQESLDEWSDDSSFSNEEQRKAKFLLSILTDTFSPTNSLVGNPAAIKEAIKTNGISLINGFNHFLDDLSNNNGLPSQVDKSKFKVAKNLAITPGKVVYRNEQLELIQYQPQTEKVYSIPFLIIPPQINKFYVYDLTQDKSFMDYCIKAGFQTLVISWRNPQKEHRHWSLANYIEALDEALDVIKEITGQKKINIMGACSGGITASVLTSYFEQQGKDYVNSLSLTVCSLSQHKDDSDISMFMSDELMETAKKQSKKSGLLKGSELSKVFSWMRPNDLIWNYVVNNYLMGKKPPAYDILYWNNDSTNLSAALHADYIDLLGGNLLEKTDGFAIKGININLKASQCDKYIVAGGTDHITPWKACYRSTDIFGGNKEFILSSSGHIQSLINPPGNPKASYYISDNVPESANEWLEGAEQKAGSWWDHWSVWLSKHSGKKKNAPKALGSKYMKPLCDAPGEYVHQQS